MLSIEDGELDLTLSEIATLIAAYSNPHMFQDLQQERKDIITEELEALKNIMKEMIG
jgi:DNA-binding transcriptional MerR regulator